MKASLANAPCADPDSDQADQGQNCSSDESPLEAWLCYARAHMAPELCRQRAVFPVEQASFPSGSGLEGRRVCATQNHVLSPADSQGWKAKGIASFAACLEKTGAFRMAIALRGHKAQESFSSLAGVVSRKVLLSACRLAGIRTRHLFTTRGRLRLRYVALPGAACFLTILATVPGMSFSAPVPFVIGESALVYNAEAAEEDVGARFAYVLKEQTVVPAPGVLAGQDGGQDEGAAPFDVAASAPASGPKEASILVGKGDTLTGLLHRAGLSVSEAYQAVTAMADQVDPRDIRPGQTVSLRFDPDDGQGYTLSKMEVFLDSVRSIVVSRDEDQDDFGVAVNEKDVERKLFAGRATVSSSIYQSATQAGIPAPVIAEAIRLYSYDVDFQRDIQQGDRLDVLYDAYVTEDGDVARQGKVLYASLNVGGRAIPIYRYQGKDGDAEYYGPDGKSIRKSLLRTPVDGARITSGFGMRRHPILGYSKMHKGMDFGAPRGTPIYAAGAGTVEKAGRNGAYGNYVRLRHNSTTKTAYAHLNGFARGLKPGAKVRQGQVIGYVGTTGRSTGPHLHYEVIVNNKQTNPAKIKMAESDALRGKELARFKAQVADIRKSYASLSGDGLKVAQVEGASSETVR